MAVGYIENKDGEKALYCTTSMQAFGPILYNNDDVEDFLDWLPNDARHYSNQELDNKYYEWKQELEDREVQLEKDRKNGLYGEQY